MSEDCTPKCGDLNAPISSSSVIYKGQILTCTGADIPDTLESIIKKLDKAICDKLSDINALNRFINTGEGIELYTGQTVFGQNQIATLTSQDNSVSITYNETTGEVNIEVDIPSMQDYIFTSIDSSVDITNTTGNEFDFSINFPAEEYLNITSTDGSVTVTETQTGTKNLSVNFPDQETIDLESADNSVTISQGTTTDKRDLSVNFPDPPTIPEQVQSDVTELSTSSKAYIKNQNPTKSISAPYTLTPADNNFVILANATSNNITITVPTPTSSFPSDNYIVGIIQKGNNNVTINGTDIRPSGYQNVIEGQGHTVAVEIIQGDIFLLGSLKENV